MYRHRKKLSRVRGKVMLSYYKTNDKVFRNYLTVQRKN